jgi:flagellar hook-associated protein 2
MATSTNLVSGLSSGFDWKSMIDQLITAEHSRVDLVTAKKTDAASKLTEWQSFNGKLLIMKNAAANLKDAEDFGVFKASMTSSSSTVSASDLLAVTTSTTASTGSYTLKVKNIATAQKLSSSSFASVSDTLGADYVGDLLINGKVINIGATDTLTGVKDKINNANSGANPTGVSAAIVAYGANDNRLIITSANTGAQGLGLQNGSGADLVQLFGWKDKTSSLRNSVTGGAQSDAFASSTQTIKDLLSLSTTQTGGIQIKDGNGVYQSVTLNLSTDSLEDIKTAINTAAIVGVTAAVTAETTDGTTTYRLQINGSQDFVDTQNILATTGVLQNGVAVVKGTTSGNAMTANGQAITSTTLLTDIDGYNKYTLGDKISLGASSRDHGNHDVSGDILTITETTTVSDLLGAIKTAYEANGDEVSAYLTSDGKIQVADQETGASSLAVDLQSTIADTYSTLNWGSFTIPLAEVRQRELVAGTDASVTVDGITVTSADNTIEDVLSGVSIDLLKADDDTTVTLSIGRDLDAIMTKISAFVTSYNTVSSYITTQNAYDLTNKKTGGILFGDGTLASVKSDMTSILVDRVWGVDADYSTLGLVGVSVDSAGKLSINSSKLRGYLTTNFNDVQKLFTATGTASTESLSYDSHGINSKAGDYTVHINTAATRSTSVASKNNTLSGDETLTITSAGSIAKVNLTGGMTMTEIVNAVNNEMSAVSQVLGGAESLYADGGQAAEITAATKWNTIYNDTGVSAGMADDDVISFSGTSRSGATVSGSYTISDIATDSVQGLLTAIETAFSNQVTASINASGQIAITDKTTGSSSISLMLDYSDTQSQLLDFGTVLTTNPSGKKGHYAMGITACADATNHLVLTHDGYGSANTFTIQQANKLLWDEDFPTVNQGLDVTGTINGEEATGTGQILTGNSGEANVDGLSIKYTGTTSGVDAGTMKLTLGVGELYDRALFHISDNIEGYVPFKLQSLQDNITAYQTQVDEMETLLTRKQEQMTNRFVQMELALQKIQSQSSWLSGQTDAAAAGWAWNQS